MVSGSYVQHSRQSYAKSVPLYDRAVEEIMVAADADQNGGPGVGYEFAIVWMNLNSAKLATRVMVFDDSWKAFTDMPELFRALSELHGESPSPEEVCDLLESLGIRDRSSFPRRIGLAGDAHGPSSDKVIDGIERSREEARQAADALARESAGRRQRSSDRAAREIEEWISISAAGD